ncbi:hypothetical protein LX32DRAFT_192010 [Colletotrichum zoysiae]|uniref:Uncharacterized protein n=1 Tax=Colletotrichum zoysiae TaxID=1216348 RepID=A0AAD9H5B3_9PEZI|nr:hypothetical protein LX32DRAFT_192010 [Colletotrichum zoysiae]
MERHNLRYYIHQFRQRMQDVHRIRALQPLFWRRSGRNGRGAASAPTLRPWLSLPRSLTPVQKWRNMALVRPRPELLSRQPPGRTDGARRVSCDDMVVTKLTSTNQLADFSSARVAPAGTITRLLPGRIMLAVARSRQGRGDILRMELTSVCEMTKSL